MRLSKAWMLLATLGGACDVYSVQVTGGGQASLGIEHPADDPQLDYTHTVDGSTQDEVQHVVDTWGVSIKDAPVSGGMFRQSSGNRDPTKHTSGATVHVWAYDAPELALCGRTFDQVDAMLTWEFTDLNWFELRLHDAGSTVIVAGRVPEGDPTGPEQIPSGSYAMLGRVNCGGGDFEEEEARIQIAWDLDPEVVAARTFRSLGSVGGGGPIFE